MNFEHAQAGKGRVTGTNMGRAKDEKKKKYNFEPSSQVIELIDKNGRKYHVALDKLQAIADHISPPDNGKSIRNSSYSRSSHEAHGPSTSTHHGDIPDVHHINNDVSSELNNGTGKHKS